MLASIAALGDDDTAACIDPAAGRGGWIRAKRQLPPIRQACASIRSRRRCGGCLASSTRDALSRCSSNCPRSSPTRPATACWRSYASAVRPAPTALTYAQHPPRVGCEASYGPQGGLSGASALRIAACGATGGTPSAGPRPCAERVRGHSERRRCARLRSTQAPIRCSCTPRSSTRALASSPTSSKGWRAASAPPTPCALPVRRTPARCVLRRM